ncbi:NB-ARC domain containing protein [Parasponia andersonii]|uniref:NB-ARC domain containing protein n=1 Tax=Parasponia andersonii TaxID=3476 RepID=A0A2P5DM80_PARAD|nr:NB-ARC domain containing protein [Parasponia andersonii]
MAEAFAKVFGEALLSAFLQVLVDRVASKEILDLFPGDKAVVKLLRNLRTVLSSANSLLNDAEEKQITDENVQKWLDELKEVIYDADDLVDKMDGEVLRREGKRRTKFKNILKFFNKKVKIEAEEILHTLTFLVDQKDSLRLREVENKSSSNRLVPSLEASDVYGREADKEAIINLLLSHDASSGNKVSVIRIVGMGGIGKTTLAQLVYKDGRIEEHFELKAWVTVSQDFNVSKITTTICAKLPSEEPGKLEQRDNEEPFELQEKLKKALRGKKFLIILDDVWNNDYDLWDSLKSSFESGASGSKIIVTSRRENVASIMVVVKTHYLSELTDEYCWKLFVKYVCGTNEDLGGSKEEIGRECVKRCKGLPLAIKTLGCLLRSDQHVHKWEGILNVDVWNKQDSKILPSLWLSYRHLPRNLKRCFAYCSIFPRGYKFEREKLILLWMAEGLLQTNDKDARMEEIGEQYVQELLSRSLFQRSGQDESFLLMHDLVHDVAIFVSGEFCFKLDKSINLHKLPSKTRHLSYKNGTYDLNKLEGLCRAERLRTFLALPLSRPNRLLFKKHSVPCHSLLASGRCLRVLSLSRSSIDKLPDSVGNMKHLRYLDLSDSAITKLPDSICTLYSLQTLLLSWCSNLTRLPKKMDRLINLRHLDIEGVPLKEVTLQLSNLKYLQTFPRMVLGPGHSWFKLKEIKELNNLGGVLKISGLENVDEKEAEEANLNDKKYLSYLSLEWSHDHETDSSQREKQILDGLQPYTNLKGLEITFYRGTVFSDWVGDSSFSNMLSICLKNCENCCFLPPLGQLPSLKDLNIDGLNDVVSIGDEFYGTGPSFRSLKQLTLRRMSKWKEWSFSEASTVQEGGIFPCLTQIKLEDCPKLEVGLPGNLPSLEDLSTERCSTMAVLLPGTQQTTTTFFQSLISVSLKNCPALESLLECGSDSKVKSLRLWHCEKLFENRVCWELERRFSSLERLEIAGWEDDSFPDDGLLPTTLKRMEINFCSNLQRLNGSAFQQLTSLEHLQIIYCSKLQCLPEQGLPTSLSRLSIKGCDLLITRCQEDGEDWPKIAQIASVVISK